MFSEKSYTNRLLKILTSDFQMPISRSFLAVQGALESHKCHCYKTMRICISYVKYDRYVLQILTIMVPTLRFGCA